jgi:hypothetical protein
VLGVRSFVVNEMPEDGTLVPEYVGAGTSYEVCFMICFIVFYLVDFVRL